MKKQLLSMVAVLVFAVAVQGGVTFSIDIHTNSLGDDVYVVTAISDGDPITSIGGNIVSDGGYMRQIHPSGLPTFLQDYNPFIPEPNDHDSQFLFETAGDNLLVVSGASDTEYIMESYFTGFAPFQSRAVVQIVLTGGEAVATLGVVAGGVLYEEIGEAEGQISALVPEPASLSVLAIGGLMMIRRR